MQDKNLVEQSSVMNEVLLVEIIKRIGDVDILRQCIDAGFFVHNIDNDFPFETSLEQLKPIINQQSSSNSVYVLDGIGESIEETPILVIPDNYNFDNESKVATQKAIYIINQAKLVDLSVLRVASSFVGPGNTVFNPEGNKHSFKSLNENLIIIGLLLGESGDSLEGRTIHSDRNSNYALELGGKILLRMAEKNIKVLKKLGVVATSEQALQIALIEGAAHEYGHAIDNALRKLNIITLERAKEMGILREIKLLNNETFKVNEEYIARAISEVVVNYYLKYSIGLSDEQVEAFNINSNAKRYFQTEAVYAFYEYATLKGFTPFEIAKMQVAVDIVEDQIFGKKEKHWYLSDLIAYNSQPYLEEQLRVLLSRDEIK